MLCYLCQIPVFKGAAKAILGEVLNAAAFHGQDGLGDVPDPNAPGLDLIQTEGAVSAMIRIVNENPGEVRVEISPLGGDISQMKVCVHVFPGFSGCHSSSDKRGLSREDGPFSAK